MKFQTIVMITEDETIFNIIKIMRTKVDQKEDKLNLVLVHHAANEKSIYLEDELKYWQEQRMMMIHINVAAAPKAAESAIQSKLGKKTRNS